MSKLGGWTRIGVVISILWSAAVFTYVAFEYVDLTEERKEKLSLPPPPKGLVLIMDKRAIFFEWEESSKTTGYVPDFQLKITVFFAAWLLPVVFMWLISLILTFTIKWIITGFSKKE